METPSTIDRNPSIRDGIDEAAKDSFKDPIYQPQRTFKVVVIGAGASGLLLAYKVQRHFDNFQLQVFEKNPAVSGVWSQNTYPGCACDSPAHCYTWSFEPKTDWSATYASASEIQQYFADFCTRHDLHKYISLQHQVIGAEWLEERAEWRVKVQDLRTNTHLETSAHVLINAGGFLSRWKWPDIPGLHSFKGRLLHSAAWEKTVDLRDKRVGLIGNGSSGIQILPAIKSEVQKLLHFIRQPTWVALPFGGDYKDYSSQEVQRFASDPEYHLTMRRDLESAMNSLFELFLKGSSMQDGVREAVRSSMVEKLKNHELSDYLIPQFPFGCRRPTPGIDYLESLMDAKVQTVIGNISRISGEDVITEDGAVYPVDVLICATGFDTTYKPSFPIVGNSGQSLHDAWETNVQGYLGLAAPQFPNYFMILGPNSPVGNGPVLVAIEQQVSYIIQMLSKFQKENVRSFEVSLEATKSFNRWKDDYMQHTVWTKDCRSWYKAGSKSGPVLALWPGSTLHYLETIQIPRYEDWKWSHPRGTNPWSFLGNGLSSAEKRPGGDLAWYIRNHDDSPVDPCLKFVSKS